MTKFWWRSAIAMAIDSMSGLKPLVVRQPVPLSIRLISMPARRAMPASMVTRQPTPCWSGFTRRMPRPDRRIHGITGRPVCPCRLLLRHWYVTTSPVGTTPPMADLARQSIRTALPTTKSHWLLAPPKARPRSSLLPQKSPARLSRMTANSRPSTHWV